MSIAPHTGIVDFGTFTAPTASTDGIQGEVPQPLAGQEGYVLTGTGWASAGSVGLVGYQGTWNALTNTPTLTSSVGTQGYYYVVDAAGTTNLNGITDWQVGDWAIFNGSVWQKVDNTDSYDPANVAITGGTINNTTIGATTPSTGVFTTLTATGQTSLGGKSSDNTDVVRVYKNNTLSGGVASFTGPAFSFIPPQDNFGAAVIGLGLSPRINSTGTDGFWFATNQTVGFTGTIQAKIAHTASAVNYVQATGAATGSGPTISAQGSDTNIGLIFNTKGNGISAFTGNSGTHFAVRTDIALATNYWQVFGDSGSTPRLRTNGGNATLESGAALPFVFATNANSSAATQLQIAHTASAVNYHQLTGSATGSGPIHSVAGSDTNIDLNLTSKGTGGVINNVNGGTFTVARDSASNAIKLTAPNQNLYVQSSGGGVILFNTSDGASLNQMRITSTASAINYVQVTGAATGSNVAITSQGSDANIGLDITAKGGGFVRTGGWLRVGVSSANYLQLASSSTGFGPVISSVGSDTDIPLVLQPKGTGALQAQQTDSTATGGNARGANAVDWQTTRDAASRVANGQASVLSGGYGNTSSALYSVVSGGGANTASGTVSTVSGGFVNTASAYGAVVSGGQNNTASNTWASIVGGKVNSALGFFNFIGAGFTNSGTANGAVTTQSGTMNATTAVTLSGSNANIKVGQYITGTSIGDDTYVAAISGTSLTLSKVASGSSTSTLSFFTPHGVVVGGGNNQATGSYSYIGGGGDAGTAGNRNVASGDWSVVGGGFKNTATQTYSSVLGGISNNSTGNASAVVGGNGNNATNTQAFVGGGTGNLANGAYSSVFGGVNGTTRGTSGVQVFPACVNPLSGAGCSQSSLLILAKQTTDATATVITSEGGAASTTNQVILPNNSAYYFRGEVISGVTGGGNTKGWFIEGVIKRGANAASTALVGTPTVTSNYADAGAAAWTIAVTADTTNGGLAVTFTGQLATTIRTVCQIRTTEMTF